MVGILFSFWDGNFLQVGIGSFGSLLNDNSHTKRRPPFAKVSRSSGKEMDVVVKHISKSKKTATGFFFKQKITGNGGVGTQTALGTKWVAINLFVFMQGTVFFNFHGPLCASVVASGCIQLKSLLESR